MNVQRPMLSQVGVLSKGVDVFIWFRYGGFFRVRPVLHCVIRKLRYLQNFFPKLTILLRHIDRRKVIST